MPFAYRLSVLALAAVLLAGSAVSSFSRASAAEEELVSTMSLVAAVETVAGMRIAPADDAPVNVYTEDLSPPQVLEIIRPDMAPITVGRLYSSCTCVRVSLTKRHFGQGERALLEVRNVKPTVAGGAKYAIFVQLTEPVKETLQYDIFVKSTAGTTKNRK